MKITQLTHNLSISGQINTQDLEVLVQEGLKTIICNRPDNEVEEQPEFNDLAQKAAELGIHTHYLPLASPTSAISTYRLFQKILSESPMPAHAFCRSGMRSFTLHVCSLLDAGCSITDIEKLSISTGYNIHPITQIIKPKNQEQS